jgi:hypothetical protein
VLAVLRPSGRRCVAGVRLVFAGSSSYRGRPRKCRQAGVVVRLAPCPQRTAWGPPFPLHTACGLSAERAVAVLNSVVAVLNSVVAVLNSVVAVLNSVVAVLNSVVAVLNSVVAVLNALRCHTSEPSEANLTLLVADAARNMQRAADSRCVP